MNNKHIYREMARKSLALAKTHLAAGNDIDTEYAALELRKAMEALTYSRALAIQDEIPPEEYKRWAPRKVLEMLQRIDPNIGVPLKLAYAEEESPVALPENPVFQSLGEDRPLTMDAIKKHYDTLGSYLHIPTFDRISNHQSHDYKKLKARCEYIILTIDNILSSTLYDTNFGTFARFDCTRCKAAIKRRASPDEEEFQVRCFSCTATYTVRNVGESKFRIIPNRTTIRCASAECGAEHEIWADELQPPKHWTCELCGRVNRLTMCVACEREDGLVEAYVFHTDAGEGQGDGAQGDAGHTKMPPG